MDMAMPKSNQADVMLHALQQHDYVSVIWAKDNLSILNPADAVYQLRKRGHSIIMSRALDLDAQGRGHVCAHYTLLRGK